MEWNDTAADYPQDRCIHQLFEEQVARTPEAVAVVFEDEQLTYGELNARANRLAHHLRGCGVGPEVLVGLCLERSPEMVVGLLGILKAGGAYVPLDPAYPQERLAFMLEDARRAGAADAAALVGAAARPRSARVLCLDRRLSRRHRRRSPQPTPAVGARPAPPRLRHLHLRLDRQRQRAWSIAHRSVVNLHARGSWRDYPSARTTSCCSRTPISFDASVWEILLPLLGGRTLCCRRRKRDARSRARLSR